MDATQEKRSNSMTPYPTMILIGLMFFSIWAYLKTKINEFGVFAIGQGVFALFGFMLLLIDVI